MANFILYWERDAGCRQKYESWLWGHVRVHRGMKRGKVAGENRGIVWAAATGTPWVQDPRCGLLLGDGGADPQVAALDLLQDWVGRQPSGDSPVLDGLHCILAAGESGWASAAGDLLGVFPIYYWGDAERVVVASSIALIEGHPRFVRQMDSKGMAGILMTNGLLAGRTLLEGVRRLAPERRLVWRLGHGVEEVERRVSQDWAAEEIEGQSLEQQIELIHRETERSVRLSLERSSGPMISLLSGGIDSRMATGYALRAGVQPKTAVTFGRTHDLEAACARAVSRHWGIRHRTIPIYEGEAESGVRSAIEWEHLAGGISNAVWIWPAARKLAGTGQRFISGMLWDWLCSFVTETHENPDYLQTLRARLNWGLGPRQMQLLFGKTRAVQLSNWVHEQLENLWLEGQARCGHPYWFMLQRLRNRFHIGTTLWTFSHYLWPVGYALDTRLIGLLSRLPGRTLASPMLREELLVRAAPEVSVFPVSSNSTTVRFVRRAENSAALEARILARPFWEQWMPWVSRGKKDLLFYSRLYAFHGHRFWDRLCRQAGRDKSRFAPRVLKREGFLEILTPRPWGTLSQDLLTETAGLKNLLALQRWYRQCRVPVRWDEGGVENQWNAVSLLPNPVRVQKIQAVFKRGAWQAQWLFASNRWQQKVNFWFEGEKTAVPNVAASSIAPALLIALGGGFKSVQVEAPVCRVLVANAEKAGKLLRRDHPGLADSEIHFEGAEARTEPASGIAAFFTGGVDSCYTAWSLRESLSELVFVHGFDIPLKNQMFFRAAHAQIQALAEDLGLKLRVVRTDLREATDLYANWLTLGYGGCLASVAHLLSATHGRMVVPASYDTGTLAPIGSTPELDPLWSSSAMQIQHHGVELDRYRKICALRGWKEGIRRLRVCWKNPGDAYNCCQCEKCMRTLVALEIAGLGGEAKSFPRRLDLTQLEGLRLGSPFVVPLWRQLERALGEDCPGSRLHQAVIHLLQANEAEFGSIPNPQALH
jgi:hypothetical protein